MTYHNFRLTKEVIPNKGIRIIGQKPLEPKYYYGCENCESEIVLKVKMTNEDFNRDIHKIYPHFACLNAKDKPHLRV